MLNEDVHAVGFGGDIDLGKIRGGSPIYIISPGYSYASRESRVLYALCHYLNVMGENAYIYPYPIKLDSDPMWPFFSRMATGQWVDWDLNVKILNQEIVDKHHSDGVVPICIVSDKSDVPFDAPFVARYILNRSYRDGLKSYRKAQEYTFCYSEEIANFTGVQDVLYLPTVDMDYFECIENTKRNGCAYYMDDNRFDEGEDWTWLFERCVPLPLNGDTAKSEIKSYFESLECFYCVSDTELAVEAALCGCKVIFPNKDRPVLSSELGFKSCECSYDDGMHGDCFLSLENIRRSIDDSYSGLSRRIFDLVGLLKTKANEVVYEDKINLPYTYKIMFVDGSEGVDRMCSEGESVAAMRGACELSSDPSLEGGRVLYRSARKVLVNFLISWVLPPRLTMSLKETKHRLYRAFFNRSNF